MLRDIVCDAASNYVLAPFLRLLTPTGFNRLLTVVFEGKWREFVDATLEKITGKSPFKGKSPVDPFCGSKYMRREAGIED